ncbi:YesL family protein [Gracilibacillus sp. YIM 98692]|uniref:YesL family protein n=1 Tax=Gracilibacillus sp. YIM 98692 TaxID=2663532 RepID=UPI0013D12853|nr:YesL family protein [Gracilibacillus sp. YIM 98692]
MFGQQIVESLDRFLKAILKIAWLNALWFIFSSIGLVVAGAFPATTAALGVARKWVQQEYHISIYDTFRQVYKREFIKSNVVGWVLTLIAGVLFLNYYALRQLGDQIPILVVFAYYFVIFLYGIIVLWVFPLMSHYQNTIRQYFKNALIIGITKIHFTLGIGFSVFFISYVSLELPSMLLFCTISFIAMATMYFATKAFASFDTGDNYN